MTRKTKTLSLDEKKEIVKELKEIAKKNLPLFASEPKFKKALINSVLNFIEQGLEENSLSIKDCKSEDYLWTMCQLVLMEALEASNYYYKAIEDIKQIVSKEI